MIKQFLIIGTALLLFSCSKKENTTFTGTIKGLSKGVIYLQKINNKKLVTIDSVSLNGSNNFNFNFNLQEPDILYLHLDKNDGTIYNDRLNIFAEPGELNLEATVDDFKKSSKITGSKNHLKLEEYNSMIQKFNLDDFKISKLNNFAKKTGKQGFVEATEVDLNNLLRRKYLYAINFALNNKELEIAPYIAVSEIDDANIKYLDTIYNSLPEHIKKSKYGIKLADLVK